MMARGITRLILCFRGGGSVPPRRLPRAGESEYYGLVSHLDARIGDILDALDEAEPHEHSTRVPLILAGPGIPPGESRALVTLFDLFPTIARLCGAAAPAGVEGQDLGPLWRGEAEAVRDVLYTAFEDTQRSVRDGRFKLIVYPKIGHEQLFDLQRDPLELRNLARDPAHAGARARLRARMEEEHAALGDPHPLAVEPRSPMAFDYRSGGAQAGRAPAGMGRREVLPVVSSS